MWFPLFISFISLWYFPNITIIYNILVSIYIIISLITMYSIGFITIMKQRYITEEFFNGSQWKKWRKNFECKLYDNQDILHIVIIPVYRENPLILDDTLQSLVEQNVSMLVGIALEERESNSEKIYEYIVRKYENKFLKLITTIHPMDLPNEVAGKASNCDYCARILVQYYEEYFKHSYSYAMVTSCDCDSIWCTNYFLYLNYLCLKNNLKNFNHIIYSPNITNMRGFSSSHILSNWMSTARSAVTHGHFRRLYSTRCFTSEYHIPLDLLKRIDFWDCDLVHEDVHMRNKLAILNDDLLSFQSTFLPCDNSTPTDINSILTTAVLLWKQSLRWNIFIYDLYYLVHMLLLNMFKKTSYENFETNSRKILQEILNNYENLFYFFLVPLSNNFFWIFYLCFFNNHPYDIYIHVLLNYVQPIFIIVHFILGFSYGFMILNSNGESYPIKKNIRFLLGLMPFPIFAVFFQGLNVTVAWIHTLKTSVTHSESTKKN